MDADETGALSAQLAEYQRSQQAMHERLDSIDSVVRATHDEARLTNGKVLRLYDDWYGPDDRRLGHGWRGRVEQCGRPTRTAKPSRGPPSSCLPPSGS